MWCVVVCFLDSYRRKVMKNVFAIVALAAAAGLANADTLAANPQDFGANFGPGLLLRRRSRLLLQPADR
jgi:hypothetical protein